MRVSFFYPTKRGKISIEKSLRVADRSIYISNFIFDYIMKDWNSLYKEKGIVEEEPSKRVIEAVNFFKQQRLKRILDLGCGTGRHTVYLLKQGFHVYGCDSSESALKISSEILTEVDFKQCDMISLPYKDEFFDGILCNFVIEHGKIAKIKKAISEMYRVLRKRGVLFLRVPSTKHPEYLTGKEIEPNTKIDIDSIDGDMPHHYFTEEEMREFFREYEIIKLEHFEGASEYNPTKKSAFWEIYARRP